MSAQVEQTAYRIEKVRWAMDMGGVAFTFAALIGGWALDSGDLPSWAMQALGWTLGPAAIWSRLLQLPVVWWMERGIR